MVDGCYIECASCGAEPRGDFQRWVHVVWVLPVMQGDGRLEHHWCGVCVVQGLPLTCTRSFGEELVGSLVARGAPRCSVQRWVDDLVKRVGELKAGETAMAIMGV